MFAIMRISSAVLVHLKGDDHPPCCIQRAFESHLGIPCGRRRWVRAHLPLCPSGRSSTDTVTRRRATSSRHLPTRRNAMARPMHNVRNGNEVRNKGRSFCAAQAVER